MALLNNLTTTYRMSLGQKKVHNTEHDSYKCGLIQQIFSSRKLSSFKRYFAKIKSTYLRSCTVHFLECQKIIINKNKLTLIFNNCTSLRIWSKMKTRRLIFCTIKYVCRDLCHRFVVLSYLKSFLSDLKSNVMKLKWCK